MIKARRWSIDHIDAAPICDSSLGSMRLVVAWIIGFIARFPHGWPKHHVVFFLLETTGVGFYVPIFHISLLNTGCLKVMWNQSPKRDIYQPLKKQITDLFGRPATTSKFWRHKASRFVKIPEFHWGKSFMVMKANGSETLLQTIYLSPSSPACASCWGLGAQRLGGAVFWVAHEVRLHCEVIYSVWKSIEIVTC